MIVKMSKVYVVSCASDRQALLDKLADLGAVHLTPVDPAAAVAAEKTVTALDSLDRAMQMLAEIEPAGDKPELEQLHVCLGVPAFSESDERKPAPGPEGAR